MGERFLTADLDLFPDVPVELEVVAVEGAQGADGLVEGAGLELAVILEVDEEVEDLFGRQFREIGPGQMVGELADPAVVGFASALGESFELDEAGVVLIPIKRSEFVAFFS